MPTTTMTYERLNLGEFYFTREPGGGVHMHGSYIPRRMLPELAQWLTMDKPLAKNDTVIIGEGPYTGYRGKILCIDRDTAFMHLPAQRGTGELHGVWAISHLKLAPSDTEKRACGCGDSCQPGHCINVPA